MTDDHVEPDPGPVELADIVDAQPAEPIALAAIVPRLASPILDRPMVPPRADTELSVDVGPLVRKLAVMLAPAVAVALAVLLIWGASFAGPIGVVAVACVVMREGARHVSFTFADGFLAFRQDRSWPRGVQEEYDVAWAWPKATR